jgi:gamma-glutamyltranspeptidase/glutathione hydrolase
MLSGESEQQPEGTNTTHFSIIDEEGNRVAATLSINFPFGSGFVVAGTGVILNDEMDDFSSLPGAMNGYGLVGGVANAIAPGKRMLSSMTPTFLETDTQVAVLGTPGGSRIISMVLLAALDFAKGNGPESWVQVPRFHHQFMPDVIEYEKGALSDAEITGLAAKGHQLKVARYPYGDMQAVLLNKANQSLSAASDKRGEGRAVVGH